MIRYQKKNKQTNKAGKSVYHNKKTKTTNKSKQQQKSQKAPQNQHCLLHKIKNTYNDFLTIAIV